MINWTDKCSELRLKLHAIDQTLDHMQITAAAMPKGALSAEGQLFEARDWITDDRERTQKATAAVRECVEHHRNAGHHRPMKAPFQGDQYDLDQRADEAEAYVIAVFDLASAAVKVAAHAVSEAAVARYDANVASLAKQPQELDVAEARV